MESPALTPEEIIRRLDLALMPGEGGWYRETYRADETIEAAALPPRYRSARSISTCIFYLLAPGAMSRMHRIPTDEIFHFYLGDPVEMLMLFSGGDSHRVTLGSDLRRRHTPQVVVPAGTWQGARLAPGGAVALLGTTVAPGFDFDDWEPGDAARLALQYPSQREWIEALGG